MGGEAEKKTAGEEKKRRGEEREKKGEGGVA